LPVRASPDVHGDPRHGARHRDRGQPAARHPRRRCDGLCLRAEDRDRGAMDARRVRRRLRGLSPQVVGARAAALLDRVQGFFNPHLPSSFRTVDLDWRVILGKATGSTLLPFEGRTMRTYTLRRPALVMGGLLAIGLLAAGSSRAATPPAGT